MSSNITGGSVVARNEAVEPKIPATSEPWISTTGYLFLVLALFIIVLGIILYFGISANKTNLVDIDNIEFFRIYYPAAKSYVATYNLPKVAVKYVDTTQRFYFPAMCVGAQADDAYGLWAFRASGTSGQSIIYNRYMAQYAVIELNNVVFITSPAPPTLPSSFFIVSPVPGSANSFTLTTAIGLPIVVAESDYGLLLTESAGTKPSVFTKTVPIVPTV
jgi:hypothetical protein